MKWAPFPVLISECTGCVCQLVQIYQVEVLWVVMPCSVVVGYQRFGGPRCLHLQGKLRQRGLLKLWHPYHNATHRHNPEDLDLKHHRRESLKFQIY